MRKIVDKVFVSLFLLSVHTQLWAVEAVGETDIGKLIARVANLIKYIVWIGGPALGMVFAWQGFMKLKDKDQDPRAGQAGWTYIGVGVGMAIVGVILGMVANYVSQQSFSYQAQQPIDLQFK